MIPKNRKSKFALDQDFEPEVIDSIIALMLTTRKWIYRRTDRVDFLDTTTTVNEAQLEFELPGGVPLTTFKAQKAYLVPLGIFKRDIPLRGLDIRDESGTLLSTLTRRENRKVMKDVFQRLASKSGKKRDLLDEGPPWEMLDKIAFQSRRLTPLRAEPESENPLLETWKKELKEVIQELCGPEDVALSTLLCDLWMGYPNIVALPPSSNPRRVVTLRHEERLLSPSEAQRKNSAGSSGAVRSLELGGSSDLDSVIGLDPDRRLKSRRPWGRALTVHLRHLRRRLARYVEPMWIHVAWGQWFGADYESNHLEVEVPQELLIDQALLYWQDGTESLTKSSWRLSTSTDTGVRAHLIRDPADWHLDLETDGKQIDRSLRAPDKGELPSADDSRRLLGLPVTKAGNSQEEPSSRGRLSVVSVLISARAKTMRASAVALGLVALGLLTVTWGIASTVAGAAPDSDTSLDAFITILVVVPTVAAAVAAQPTAHELSGVLVRPLRELITVLGALPVIAAVLLILLENDSIDLSMMRASLIVLGIVSILVLGLLFVQAWKIYRGSDGEPLLRSRPRGLDGDDRSGVDARKEAVTRELKAFPTDVHLVQSVEGLRFAPIEVLEQVPDGGPPTNSQIIDSAEPFIKGAAW